MRREKMVILNRRRKRSEKQETPRFDDLSQLFQNLTIGRSVWAGEVTMTADLTISRP